MARHTWHFEATWWQLLPIWPGTPKALDLQGSGLMREIKSQAIDRILKRVITPRTLRLLHPVDDESTILNDWLVVKDAHARIMDHVQAMIGATQSNRSLNRKRKNEDYAGEM